MATMAESKILQMDITGFDEFVKALHVFNTVGNGQMLIDRAVIEKALRENTVTEKALKELLAVAKGSGVAVYCKGSRENEAFFGRLGFAGIIEPEHLVPVQLNDLPLRKFAAQDIPDIRIPQSMNEEQLREAFAKLPLENTMVFHSADAERLVHTRDIENNKSFAALFSLLLNFGREAVTTPETARRLGYHWDVRGIEGSNRITALADGQLEASGIARDSALYEQAMELSPELRKPFLAAIAAKLLIVNAMAQKDGRLSEAYAAGNYRFTKPSQEEMLGEALLAQNGWKPAQLQSDREAAEKLKADAQEDSYSFLERMQAGIKAGHPQEGSLTAVIDLLLMDVIAEHSMKSMKHNQGTLDTRAVNSVLSAA